MVPEADGKRFLRLARETVSGAFKGIDPEDHILKEKYQKKQGVFVTLKKKGELRGCIGFPEPVIPLYTAVKEAAKEAAFGDPRFPEVTESELEDISFEISILSVPQELKNQTPEGIISSVRIGQDGLIIRGHSSGLLLPQVATEWGFSQEKFLEEVSRKAGLGKDAWKNPRNRLFTFQAQIFMEP